MPNVNVCPMPKQQFFSGTGAPLAGGKVYTKAADTNTDKATYSDYTGLTENSNPIILDSEGRASIYLEAGAYKFIVNNSDDVLVYTQNGVSNSSTAVSVDTVADLKALSVVSVTLIRTLGYSVINDGGEALYYYDPDSELDDNGGSVIVPDTVPSSGRWILVPAGTKELNARVFGLACDGSTDDATKLAACSTYCAANDLTMVIDDDVYFASNITLDARIRLLPGVVLTWGSFKPTIDALIDKGDYTQHFDCTASYVPITTIKKIECEWFGETADSCPITRAAIAEVSSEIVDYSDASTISGFSSFTTKEIRYRTSGKRVDVWFNLEGVSNSNAVSFTLPFNNNTTDSMIMDFIIYAVDNSVSSIGRGNIGVLGSGNVVSLSPSATSLAWVTSGDKMAYGQFFYFTE